ncbi:unnamed protein product [Lepidochelys kempii]
MLKRTVSPESSLQGAALSCGRSLLAVSLSLPSPASGSHAREESAGAAGPGSGAGPGRAGQGRAGPGRAEAGSGRAGWRPGQRVQPVFSRGRPAFRWSGAGRSLLRRSPRRGRFPAGAATSSGLSRDSGAARQPEPHVGGEPGGTGEAAAAGARRWEVGGGRARTPGGKDNSKLWHRQPSEVTTSEVSRLFKDLPLPLSATQLFVLFFVLVEAQQKSLREE